MANAKRAVSLGVVSVLAIVIIIVAGFGVYLSTMTSASTMTRFSTTSETSKSQTSVTASLYSGFQCSTMYPNGTIADISLVLNSNSPAQLCLEYYYYNSTSALSLSPSSQVHILENYHVPNSNGSYLLYANSSEFSIQATYDGSENNLANVTLGGQNNLNEGIPVLYTITDRNSTLSGPYYIGFDALRYPGGDDCETNLEVLVGNFTLPPGVLGGGGPCLAQPAGTKNSQGFTEGYLYAEIVGTTNSTS
jgi:hypothetical protein